MDQGISDDNLPLLARTYELMGYAPREHLIASQFMGPHRT